MSDSDSRPQTQQSNGSQQQQQNNNNSNQKPQTNQSQRSQNNNQQQQGPPLNINVPCIYNDHEDAIMGICFKPNCEKKSRLVCFTCAISTHHDHAQFIVRLSDMSKSDDLFIRNWPNQPMAQEINNYMKVNNPEQIDNIIEEQFAKHEKQYLNELEKCKQKVKQDVKDKLKKNTTLLKDVEQKLDDTFNLKGTKSMIAELNDNKLEQAQFEKKIQEFLTGKTTQIYQLELENLFQEKAKKVQHHFNVDLLTHFFEKSVKVIEDTPQLLWPKNATVKIDNRGNVGSITSGLSMTGAKSLNGTMRNK